MRTKFLLQAGLGLCLVLGLAGGASAAIVITAGPGGGNPDENLVFNKPGLNLNGLTTTGTIVQGATNQTQAVLDMAV